MDIPKKIELIINQAYLDLVQWEEKTILPETLTMDANRITAASNELTRLNYAGTILLLIFSQAGANLASIAEWKSSVKKTILTLITPGSKPDLKAIGCKMVSDVQSAATQYNATGYALQGLEDAIEAVDSNHKIYVLLRKFFLQFD